MNTVNGVHGRRSGDGFRLSRGALGRNDKNVSLAFTCICSYLRRMTAHKPPPAASFACTCLRLRKAARRITQLYDGYVEPFGLTITQFGLLAHLRVLDGISVGALAEQLVMDPTTLTRNLRPLERKGFVRLARDPNDRRSRSLHLTEAGREILRAARPGWVRAQQHVEQTLGNADTAGLNAALDRMLERFA
jgi:DNA-binding MarR family transcriptional regulator